MIRGYTSRKSPREQAEQWLDNEISFPSTPGCQLVDSPIILEALIEGFLVRRIYVDGGSSSKVMYEHCFGNLRAETRATLKESRTPLVGFSGKGPVLEGMIAFPRIPALGSEGTANTSREEIQGKTKEGGEPEDTVQPPPSPPKKDAQIDEKIEGKDEHPERPLESKPPEKVVIHDDYPDQIITIGGNLFVKAQTQDVPTHRAEGAKETVHTLDIIKIVKDEVAEWLKAGIVKKDLYPLLEIDWKIEFRMGFKYKCFLDAYKGYHQIQMTKKDEEKMAFHTDEGVFCYTKMPFGLKNVGATYQRLVDTIFEGQIRRNLEAYVDDMVIKSKVLGYIVTSEGIRANPEKAKTVVNMPSPSTLKQMQRLSGKLAALNRFLSKASKKALPCLDTLKKCVMRYCLPRNFRTKTPTTRTVPDEESSYKLIAELNYRTAKTKEMHQTEANIVEGDPSVPNHHSKLTVEAGYTSK
ncbi:reverse transcriptase domain-containing protein [Tanacetum coccineum]